MQRIFNFLHEAGCYFLTTLDSGKPCIRPFGSCLLFEGKLYFCTGDFKDVYDQLRANPHVAMCALAANGDWLRVTGEAVFDDRLEPAAAMYELFPTLREIYGNPERDMKVCYLKNGRAQFHLENGALEEIEF